MRRDGGEYARDFERGEKMDKSAPYLPTHRTVLGLDPRTIGRLCRTESGPRIKSEGGPVVGPITFPRYGGDNPSHLG